MSNQYFQRLEYIPFILFIGYIWFFNWQPKTVSVICWRVKMELKRFWVDSCAFWFKLPRCCPLYSLKRSQKWQSYLSAFLTVWLEAEGTKRHFFNSIPTCLNSVLYWFSSSCKKKKKLCVYMSKWVCEWTNVWVEEMTMWSVYAIYHV